MSSEVNRRQFVHRSLATATAASSVHLVSSHTVANDGGSGKGPAQPLVGAFTKSFQDRPIPEVCRIFQKIGLDGLDLTVRPGGHIEPKDVAAKLPVAAQAAKEAGVRILFLTTAITDADKDAERLLATAAEVGIDRIKLGYYRYKTFGMLARELKQVRQRIAGVIKLAARYKVLPCVHVHSGNFIPSHGTQLHQLIENFTPQEVGAYVDPLHMALEGGRDGWRQGLDLLAPWIALCSVKNFDWTKEKRDKHGQQLWRTRTVPPADGICPLPQFVHTLKKIGFQGPYSLHSEYKSSHSFRRLDTDGCIAQTATDLKYFRKLL